MALVRPLRGGGRLGLYRRRILDMSDGEAGDIVPQRRFQVLALTQIERLGEGEGQGLVNEKEGSVRVSL